MVVKITYSYDGSKFYGMQRQKNHITVQGEIERILLEVFNEKINLVSSGRTDKGVHALAQVSNFTIHNNIPLKVIQYQLNKHLYGKLKINKIEYIDDNFNSRYDAKYRIYEYRFKLIENITPFEANYVTSINLKELDLNKINENLKLFVGVHNFTHFSKTDKSEKNPIRQIYNATCEFVDNTYIINIVGSSFLKSMVRLLVASAIYETKDIIQKRLELKYLNKPKKILSPHGLYLKEVNYDKN